MVDNKLFYWQLQIVIVLLACSPVFLYAQDYKTNSLIANNSISADTGTTESFRTEGKNNNALHIETRYDAFYRDYIKDRLEIGTRISHRFLTDKDSGHKGGYYKSGTYLGTIYALDEKQNYCPDFFINYYFTQYLGLAFSYDYIKAKTLAWSSSRDAIKTDGDVSLSGPTISFIARYPNWTRFTPYAGVGVGLFHGDFDRDSVWAYSDWGSVQRHRYMYVDNIISEFVDVGVTYTIYKNWFIDGSMEYMHADPDATFKGYSNTTLTTINNGHFPLNNISLNLGVGYSF